MFVVAFCFIALRLIGVVCFLVCLWLLAFELVFMLILIAFVVCCVLFDCFLFGVIA